MARARAVIASHATVGATARRRPITRVCLLGLLASWWVLAFVGLVGRGRARPGGILTESHRSLRELCSTGVDRPQSGPECDRGRRGRTTCTSRRGRPAARKPSCSASSPGRRRRPWRPAPRTRSEATVHIPPLPLGNYYLIARVNASQQLRGDEYREQCRGDALPHRTARRPLSNRSDRAGLGDDPAIHLGVVDGRQLRVSPSLKMPPRISGRTTCTSPRVRPAARAPSFSGAGPTRED